MIAEDYAQRTQYLKDTLYQLMRPHVQEAMLKMSLLQPKVEIVEGELKIIITETEQEIIDQLVEVRNMYMKILGMEETLLGD